MWVQSKYSSSVETEPMVKNSVTKNAGMAGHGESSGLTLYNTIISDVVDKTAERER